MRILNQALKATQTALNFTSKAPIIGPLIKSTAVFAKTTKAALTNSSLSLQSRVGLVLFGLYGVALAGISEAGYKFCMDLSQQFSQEKAGFINATSLAQQDQHLTGMMSSGITWNIYGCRSFMGYDIGEEPG